LEVEVNKLLLTPEEAAEVLGIGRTKVYALMADGDLLSVRIGKSRRLPVGGLNDYIERLEDEARMASHPPTRRLVAR
jgi:excisionase family DNA binding protein